MHKYIHTHYHTYMNTDKHYYSSTLTPYHLPAHTQSLSFSLTHRHTKIHTHTKINIYSPTLTAIPKKHTITYEYSHFDKWILTNTQNLKHTQQSFIWYRQSYILLHKYIKTHNQKKLYIQTQIQGHKQSDNHKHTPELLNTHSQKKNYTHTLQANKLKFIKKGTWITTKKNILSFN